MTGKNHRYAVVDGQVVKPGDQINGARVVAIKANAVTLKQNDTRQVLSLTPGSAAESCTENTIKPIASSRFKAFIEYPPESYSTDSISETEGYS